MTSPSVSARTEVTEDRLMVALLNCKAARDPWRQGCFGVIFSLLYHPVKSRAHLALPTIFDCLMKSDTSHGC
jgi:hypothetical protein